MARVRTSCASVKKLIDEGLKPDHGFQLLWDDLVFTTTGAGEGGVNDRIIRDRIDQASLKQAVIILSLP